MSLSCFLPEWSPFPYRLLSTQWGPIRSLVRSQSSPSSQNPSLGSSWEASFHLAVFSSSSSLSSTASGNQSARLPETATLHVLSHTWFCFFLDTGLTRCTTCLASSFWSSSSCSLPAQRPPCFCVISTYVQRWDGCWIETGSHTCHFEFSATNIFKLGGSFGLIYWNAWGRIPKVWLCKLPQCQDKTTQGRSSFHQNGPRPTQNRVTTSSVSGGRFVNCHFN